MTRQCTTLRPWNITVLLWFLIAFKAVQADQRTSPNSDIRSTGRRFHPTSSTHHTPTGAYLNDNNQAALLHTDSDHSQYAQKPPPQKAAALSTRGGAASGKLSSLKERTIWTVLMLGGLILWLDTFREPGLILLVMLIQVGLYIEGINVVLSYKELKDRKNQDLFSIKWWWFIAYNLALIGPRLLEKTRDGNPLLSPSSIYLASYSMVALGIVNFVVTLNNSIAFSYEFQVALKELAVYHLAIVLLVLPASFWIATLQDFGMNYQLFSFYLVVINDVMAYISGVSFGKHPLLPTISPKKTWEGFLGALVSTMSISVVLWRKMGLEVGVDSTKHALVIAAYISLVAPFGGFLASIVKRAYGKKDFSNLIPGHGGFIDRLDCQLITAPFMYLYLKRFVLPWKH